MEEKRSEVKMQVSVSADVYELNLEERVMLFAKAINEVNEKLIAELVTTLRVSEEAFVVSVGASLIPGNSVEGQNLLEGLERE